MPNIDVDLLIVGRGYAAATYLYMADLRWCRTIAVVGGTDSWATTIRGDGIVNHAAFMFARDPAGRKSGDVDVLEQMKSRADLAKTNADILTAATDTVYKDKLTLYPGLVTAIERKRWVLKEDEAFELKLDGLTLLQGKAQDALQRYEATVLPFPDDAIGADPGAETTIFRALKVVYAGGAGPHTPPATEGRGCPFTGTLAVAFKTYVKDDGPPVGKRVAYPVGAQIMDLDTFMRRAGQLTRSDGQDGKVRVAVVGPNAGIDAAVRALDADMELTWLIRGPYGTRPAWVATRHYRAHGADAVDAAEDCVINYRDLTADFASPDGDAPKPLKITLDGAVQLKDRQPPSSNDQIVDYLVYAIGQSADMTEAIGDKVVRIGPQRALAPILEADKTLLPIYDRNGRFGQWFETAVGARDRYAGRCTGLEVVGAAAVALARGRKIRQDYLDTARGAFLGAEALNLRLQATQDSKGFSRLTGDVKNLGFALNADCVRLFDYFLQQGQIPSVLDSIMTLPQRLNQRSIAAGDQLGTVRSQIELVTDFALFGKIEIEREAAALAHGYLGRSAQALKAVADYEAALGAKPKDDQKIQAATTKMKDAAQAALEAATALGFAGPLWDHWSDDTFKDRIGRMLGAERAARLQKIGGEVTFLDHELKLKAEHLPASAQDWKSALQDSQSLVTDFLFFLQPAVAEAAVDFNGMDRTQLAVFLAARYPGIPAAAFDGIVSKIVAGRSNRPGGYSDSDGTSMLSQLAVIDEDPGKAATFSAP